MVFSAFLGQAQKPEVVRVDPPNWWTGMYHNTVQLCIYGKGLANSQVSINKKGVEVSAVKSVENPNYLFVDLTISQEAKPGKYSLEISNADGKTKLKYELGDRGDPAMVERGVGTSDFIYLLMPDRFANGNPENDRVEGMLEQSVNRKKMFSRHGGDISGIMQHLDYLQDLGVTALWLNPVLVNDMKAKSYHGYAATDHYAVDPRFGGNEAYLALSAELKKRGMKLIKDMVYNHIGDKHYLIQDLPAADWVHQHDTFTRTTYRAPTLMDPYRSERDYKTFTDGWFDTMMPDLNQQNPNLAKYLIQNSIWWVETAGLAGFRIDTYAYADQQFMADLVKAIRAEYPQLGVFGETWVHGAAVQSFFTEKNGLQEMDTYLPGVTDFQLYYAINEALTGTFGWTNGAARLYYTLAKDFLYSDPNENVVFLDNHDVSRFYSVVGENFDKYKMGIALMLTMRGIPQIYYGTEILMKNFADPDGKVRDDFPGGWEGDAVDKFNPKNLSGKEAEAFQYVRSLARYRKDHPALHSGKLMQFVPEDGVYVYFRYNSSQTVMVVLNCSDQEKELNLDRFTERLNGFSSGKDIGDGSKVSSLNKLSLKPWDTKVLELKK